MLAAAPEALREPRDIRLRNAAAIVGHAKPCARPRANDDRRAARRIFGGIVDQIFERQHDRLAVAVDRSDRCGDVERDRPSAGDDPGCAVRDHALGHLGQIEPARVARLRLFELGERKQLPDHARGAVDRGHQVGAHAGIADRVGAQADRGERGAQFVRDIGGERALDVERLDQPVERGVGGFGERLGLARQHAERQARFERAWADRRGDRRDRAHPQRQPAREQYPDQRHERGDRQDQQREALEEGANDVVGDDFGVGIVLRHDDPAAAAYRQAIALDRAAAEETTVVVERRCGEDRAARRAAAAGEPSIGGEGRNRHPARQRHRRHSVSGARIGDDFGLALQQRALEMVGGLVEQRRRAPQQGQRRDHRDRDVEHDELPEQRARCRHRGGVASSI